MKLTDLLFQHLLTHQQITYKELVAYAKQTRSKVVTGNRYLQSHKKSGRNWNWLRYDINGILIKGNKPWFIKRLRKPLTQLTVFKKK